MLALPAAARAPARLVSPRRVRVPPATRVPVAISSTAPCARLAWAAAPPVPTPAVASNARRACWCNQAAPPVAAAVSMASFPMGSHVRRVRPRVALAPARRAAPAAVLGQPRPCSMAPAVWLRAPQGHSRAAPSAWRATATAPRALALRPTASLVRPAKSLTRSPTRAPQRVPPALSRPVTSAISVPLAFSARPASRVRAASVVCATRLSRAPVLARATRALVKRRPARPATRASRATILMAPAARRA
jgi:hypothetical protein